MVRSNAKEAPARAMGAHVDQEFSNDWEAYVVTIGAKVDPEEEKMNASMKNVKADDFSVSVRGKELLKNTSVTIVHGRRYGLVGHNGTGKSSLLKLLAWRRLSVPTNMEVLLVEQEVVGG